MLGVLAICIFPTLKHAITFDETPSVYVPLTLVIGRGQVAKLIHVIE